MLYLVSWFLVSWFPSRVLFFCWFPGFLVSWLPVFLRIRMLMPMMVDDGAEADGAIRNNTITTATTAAAAASAAADQHRHLKQSEKQHRHHRHQHHGAPHHQPQHHVDGNQVHVTHHIRLCRGKQLSFQVRAVSTNLSPHLLEP